MEESPTSTQIETAEHEIILVEQPRIRPDDEPHVLGSLAHRRIPYSLVDRFILGHEGVVPVTPGKASRDSERSRRPPATGALK